MVIDKYGHECDKRCYSLLEAIPEAVHVIDREYKLVFINEAFKKWVSDLGIQIEIGKSVFDIFPFLSYKTKEDYDKVFETHHSITTQDITKINGVEFTTETTKVPNMCINNDTTACIITIVKNTTPYTDSLKYLKLNEERLESLLKLSQFKANSEEDLVSFALEEGVRLTFSDVGFFHFVEGTDTLVNLKLIKWSKKVYDDCFVTQNQHYSIEKAGNWVDCIREKRPIIYNDYQNSPNRKGYPEGHFPISRFMSVPVFDENKIVAVVGVGNKQTNYDETDLRQLHLFMNSMWKMIKSNRAEKAQTISETRYRRLFETAQDGILLVDANTAQIIDVNPYLIEML
jgi:PAS domain-containing protein